MAPSATKSTTTSSPLEYDQSIIQANHETTPNHATGLQSHPKRGYNSRNDKTMHQNLYHALQLPSSSSSSPPALSRGRAGETFPTPAPTCTKKFRLVDARPAKQRRKERRTSESSISPHAPAGCEPTSRKRAPEPLQSGSLPAYQRPRKRLIAAVGDGVAWLSTVCSVVFMKISAMERNGRDEMLPTAGNSFRL